MGVRPHRLLILTIMGLSIVFGLLFSAPAFAKNNSVFKASNNTKFSRMESGQYTVEVLLNGQGPFVFMIDSAATRTSIFEATLKKLKLQKQPATEALISGMIEARLRPTVKLQSLSFGKTVFKDHSIVILEDWDEHSEPLDGILGMEIMQQFALVFSHEDSRLRIRERFNARAIQYEGWNKIQLISNPYPVNDYGLKFTGAKIGKSLIPALIDTGANFTTISWNSVKGSKLGKEKKRLREEWVIQGAIGEFKPSMVVKLDKIIIGGILLNDHEMLLMDFEKMQVNGKGQYPLIIAGIDLIGGRDFVLDFKNDIIYVEPRDWKPRFRNNTARLLGPRQR